MIWTTIDTWISLTAGLIAIACVIPGVFLFLSRQSMLSHGLAHAVLPGIVIAFLIHHQRDMVSMLIGAVIAGVITGILTRFIEHTGRVESGASLGIVFTTLFAFGIVLMRLFADFAHIEPSHVLYGSLEMSILADGSPPNITIRSAIIVAFNMLALISFFKELKLVTFDPGLAASLGFKPRLIHYGIMSITATTAVIAFESVGSILVVAMMITPPATAYLLTKNLKKLIVISILISASSAILGHVFSIQLYGKIISLFFGFESQGSTNTAGGIAIISSFFFIFVILLKRKRQAFL